MSAYGVKEALILEAIHINILVWARIIVLDLPSGLFKCKQVSEQTSFLILPYVGVQLSTGQWCNHLSQ